MGFILEIVPLNPILPGQEYFLTLKDVGGAADSAHWSEDRLPFLTGSYYGHKNS